MDILSLMHRAGLQRIRDQGKPFIAASCPNTEAHPNGDRHPSFAINRDTGWGVCLGCGWKPSPEQWVAKAMGISHKDARAILGVDAPTAVQSSEISRLIMTLEPHYEDLAGWDEETVMDVPYLRQRGYTDQLIQQMGIRYHPSSSSLLIPWLTATNQPCYIKVRGTTSTTRYLASYGDKGSHVYGEWLYLKKVPELWVVEGELDALRLIQGGKNAVAVGTARASVGQAQRIVRMAQRVVVLPDRDEAGYIGAKQSLRTFLNFTPHVYLGEYPVGFDGKDAGDMQAEQVKELICRNFLHHLFQMF